MLPHPDSDDPLLPKNLLVEWLNHPCTRGLIKNVKRDRTALMEQWASGSFTDSTSAGTAQLNAKALGQINVLDDLLDSFNQLQEQLSENHE